jgi:hypothetical protein
MRGTKGILAIAIVAALAVTITAAGATAGASSGNAVAAKKKCKKKKHATSAKKKSCKKRKNVPPVSVVRATLTWSGGGDSTNYDLYVFDSSGRIGRATSDAIPASVFSPNVTGSSGTETFTDLDANQHRVFSFGVCHQDGGNDGSSYSIEYVSANGTHFTDTQAGTGSPYAAKYDDSGGPPQVPDAFTCLAP